MTRVNIENTRILYTVSDSAFFVSHRLNLAERAMELGFEVAIASPSGQFAERCKAIGMKHFPLEMVRHNSSLTREIFLFIELVGIVKQFRPHLLHNITAKPVVYGGIISRLLGIPSISAVPGLGHLFISRKAADKIKRALLMIGYKYAVGHFKSHLIFQNHSDLELFKHRKLIGDAKSSLIPGSGVDLKKIRATSLPEGTNTTLLLPARMIYNKGVLEFVQAARAIRGKGVEATFRLLGDPDDGNPTSIRREQLQEWVNEGVVEWQPYTEDINLELAKANIVVLPTHGGEGLPKTLIDAAAAGRPSAASSVPGCRDAIIDGETGVLFDVEDSDNIIEVLEGLIMNRERQASMGLAARIRAENFFDIFDVSEKHMNIYVTQLELKP